MRKLFTLLALAAAAPALAMLAVPASVEELTRSSQLVVRGRVAKVSAQLTEDGHRVFTYVDVQAASVWRGVPTSRVTVVVPGGVVGDFGQRVSGAPSFAPNEEVVVFLGEGERGLHRVTGLAQGKFTVKDGSATPQLSDVSFVRQELKAGERRAEGMPVAELEQRVRSVK